MTMTVRRETGKEGRKDRERRERVADEMTSRKSALKNLARSFTKPPNWVFVRRQERAVSLEKENPFLKSDKGIGRGGEIVAEGFFQHRTNFVMHCS